MVVVVVVVMEVVMEVMRGNKRTMLTTLSSIIEGWGRKGGSEGVLKKVRMKKWKGNGGIEKRMKKQLLGVFLPRSLSTSIYLSAVIVAVVGHGYDKCNCYSNESVAVVVCD